jgi:hypothetical protein
MTSTNEPIFVKACPTQQSMVEHILKNLEGKGEMSLNGREVWTVEFLTEGVNPTLAVYVLVKKEDPATPRHGHWGYTRFTEAEGPAYYKCPKKFFALVPVVNQEWRDKCLVSTRVAVPKTRVKKVAKSWKR